jgi:hypothetical protein
MTQALQDLRRRPHTRGLYQAYADGSTRPLCIRLVTVYPPAGPTACLRHPWQTPNPRRKALRGAAVPFPARLGSSGERTDFHPPARPCMVRDLSQAYTGGSTGPSCTCIRVVRYPPAGPTDRLPPTRGIDTDGISELFGDISARPGSQPAAIRVIMTRMAAHDGLTRHGTHGGSPGCRRDKRRPGPKLRVVGAAGAARAGPRTRDEAAAVRSGRRGDLNAVLGCAARRKAGPRPGNRPGRESARTPRVGPIRRPVSPAAVAAVVAVVFEWSPSSSSEAAMKTFLRK